MSQTLVARLAGTPLVLLLDIDGTLSPIAPRPQDAAISPVTRAMLADLSRLPDVHVVAISGRGAADAARLIGLDTVWIVGNHGIEVAAPGQVAIVDPEIARFGDQLAAASVAANDVARRTPGVILEDKRWTLSVHYRLMPRTLVPELTARITDIANRLGLELSHGKEVIELRPLAKVDKGTAALELAGKLGGLARDAALLCAGDDRTDEDMFRALRMRDPRCVTVHVGGSAVSTTIAEFSVPDTTAMHELLATLLAQRQAQSKSR